MGANTIGARERRSRNIAPCLTPAAYGRLAARRNPDVIESEAPPWVVSEAPTRHR